MKTTYPTMPMAKAQKNLPKLCRSGRAYLITNNDLPSTVLLSIDDYEALMETLDLLSNPQAVAALRAAKAGRLKYKKLDLNADDFGV